MAETRTVPPALQLGWLLDMPSQNVPVNLKAEGLAAHTAVIAQSGSGKSFMLGRLIEEIASKTKARVLILDPNSDFAKCGAVDESAWERHDGKFAAEDTKADFERRWKGVGARVLTKRQANPGATAADPLSLAWLDLDMETQAELLGVSLRSGSGVAWAFSRIRQPQAGQAGCDDLARWAETAGKLERYLAESHPDLISGERSTVEDVRTIMARIDLLQEAGVWDSGGPRCSAQLAVRNLFDAGPPRLVSLDLGSLADAEHRHVTAEVALDALWRRARQTWEEALAKPSDEDGRCPVFVVIDEAHNLAPENPTTAAGQRVVDRLVTIAMEGRKYGLFLILVTQRPSRVNNNLLSQCDNLCLLKMSNPADVALVEERFGFVPRGWAERALAFEKGNVLLSGQFVDRPVYAKVAPRRTVEGGRSLRDAVWLADPLPASDVKPAAS